MGHIPNLTNEQKIILYEVKKEPFLLSSDLLKVEDFDYLPKMIKPLTLTELREFFRAQAKEIGMNGVE